MAVAQSDIPYINGNNAENDISMAEIARSSSSSNPCNILTDYTLIKAIWGPFYYFSKITFQLLPLNPAATTKLQKFKQYIPNIISISLLFARGIYMFYYMLKAPELTIIWCYTKCLFFFALHALIAAIIFTVWKNNNFYTKTLKLFRRATRENFTIKTTFFKPGHVIYYFFIALYIIGMAYYCVINVTVFSDKVTVYILNDMPHNETELFRKSMFGIQSLYFFDIIIILWGAYLSAICLTVYMCTNDALCQEYSSFLKNLQSLVDDKTITKVKTIENIEAQLIDYLKLAKFLNENVLRILQISFIIGIFSYLISQFCLQVFGDFIENDKATFTIWLIISICLLGIAVNTPAAFKSLINETVDIFYLDHGIWRECTDEKVKSVVRDILNRLKDADYGYKGVSFSTASAILFNLIVIVIPFVVNLLSPYAVMPMPLKKI